MSDAPAFKPTYWHWLFFLVSFSLGWATTLDGVYARLWGSYWFFPLGNLMTAWGISPFDVGWVCVVSGQSLVAASFGVLASRGWGYYTGLIAALVLGALYLGWGTVPALVCVLALLLPPTRKVLFP
jgi:hypothetical protein